jgi:hypothetical protein
MDLFWIRNILDRFILFGYTSTFGLGQKEFSLGDDQRGVSRVNERFILGRIILIRNILVDIHLVLRTRTKERL